MSKFKKGDKVTKRENKQWMYCEGIGEHNPYGPKFGEIVTVNHYDPEPDDDRWVNFDEYNRTNPINGLPEYYNEDKFEKVISDRVLSEELESVPEPFAGDIQKLIRNQPQHNHEARQTQSTSRPTFRTG